MTLPVQALRRHVVALGASGSGKTVLCKCLVEEAVRKDIPTLIVDPQGDVASLALRGDPGELEARGTALSIQQEFFEKARVALFTPASTKGIPLSANPLRFPPPGMLEEEALVALTTTAASLASFLGYELDSPVGKGVKAYLAGLLEHLWREGREVRDLTDFAKLVKRPPGEATKELQGYVRPHRPGEIARRLRQHTAAAGKLMFQTGVPMDMAMFLDRSDGRVPVNVVYLNTLVSGNEKQFYLATLLREVYLWMLQNPVDGVQLLLYVDEIAPYLPHDPYNPPAKETYEHLFRQARKYGVGLVAATQNPAEIEYKALSQVSTWCLGRLMTSQHFKRVRPILRSIDPLGEAEVLNLLPSLKPGELVMLSPDVVGEALHFRVRWLATDHRTLDDTEIPQVLSEETRAFYERYAMGKGAAEPPSPVPEAERSPDDAVALGLRAEGKALTVEEVAGTAGVPVEQARESLEGLRKQGAVEARAPEEGEGEVYFAAGTGLRPELGITGEVQVVRLMVPQVEALQRAQRFLEGGLFSKDEEVVDARFSYVPLWRVEASWLDRKLLVLRELEVDAFYLHAGTGAFLSLEGPSLRFDRLVDRGAGVLRDLDEDPDVLFEPTLPSEVEDFPEVGLDRQEAFKRVHRTFGADPIAGGLVLLPVWTLTIRHKDTKKERSILLDGATGRFLVGDLGA